MFPLHGSSDVNKIFEKKTKPFRNIGAHDVLLEQVSKKGLRDLAKKLEREIEADTFVLSGNHNFHMLSPISWSMLFSVHVPKCARAKVKKEDRIIMVLEGGHFKI